MHGGEVAYDTIESHLRKPRQKAKDLNLDTDHFTGVDIRDFSSRSGLCINYTDARTRCPY